MESFFSSLKTERTSRKTYRKRDDGRADLFDYVKRFYNPEAATLDYRSYEPNSKKQKGRP